MRVLDLFAGLEGWSAPWRQRGHDAITVDNDPRFGSTITHDLLDPDGLVAALGAWRPDVVLASPPCEAFSAMTIGRNWTRDAFGRPAPKTEKARIGMALVEATLRLVRELGPAYWIVENPRAMARTLASLSPLERRTVTYCQFGERTQKPTDLWGAFPPSLVLAPPCQQGAECHVRAPRGSRTGIQGSMGTGLGINSRELAAIRAKVPERLSLAVCLAAEADLAAGLAPVPATLWALA